MSNPGDRLKIFEGILSSQSYDLLKLFRDDVSWEGLLPEEKEVLAQLFLLSAESEQLSPGSSSTGLSALDAYRCACRLAPKSARSWYRLGVYLAFQEDAEALQEASCALSTAVNLDAGFYDAQHALASVSLRLGVIWNDEDSLHVSDESFVRAAALLPNPTPQLYWHWGLARLLLAQRSGEPKEYMLALELYEKADELGIQNADFCIDYAHALTELGSLVRNMSYIEKAIDLFFKALALIDQTLSKERAVCYYQLGSCYQQLYEHFQKTEALQLAFQNFSRAVVLDEKYTLAYQKWGQLLFSSARFCDKRAYLEEALEKFKKAEECGSLHPLVFALGALSLLCLTEGTDRPEVLDVASQLALRAERLSADSSDSFPEVYAALALCQVQLGQYFVDEQYFIRATDIIRDGLDKHHGSPLLWHVLAVSRTMQARVADDEQFLKDALVAFFIAAQTPYARIPSLWSDWGMALGLLGEWTESKEAITEAIAKFEAAKNLGCEVTPTWIFSLACMYDTLSILLDDENCSLQAIDLLETLNSNVPDHSMAICQLGICYSHLGQLTEDEGQLTIALDYLEQYLEDEHEDDMALLEYANLLIHRGFFYKDAKSIPQDWFLAEEAFFKVIALGNDTAYYHLATLYALFGDVSQAIFYLHEGLEKDSLPPLDDIKDDEWLASIASTAAFENFLRKAEEDSVPLIP